MDAIDFARLCLEPSRLAALGRAVEGQLSADALAEALDVSRRDALTVIADLRVAGLVDATGALNRETVRAIAQAIPGPEEPAPHILEGEWTEEERKVLRTFFAGEHLTEIPSNRAKRRTVLERLAQDFDPGDRYPEAEVSRRLEHYHPDYAALRRYLVDEGILSRSEGVYWRSGGRFPLDALNEQDGGASVTNHPRLLLAAERPDVTLVSYDAISLENVVAVANDERIARFMTDRFPHPYTEQDAATWLGIAVALDPVTAFAVLVNGEFAGGVGGEPHKDIRTGTAEIGWWLNPAWWGSGITTAAVRRFIEYCFTDLDLRRVEAGVFVTNPASARVAEKAGMTLEGISKAAYLKSGHVIDRLNYGLVRSARESPNAGI
ncbi:MAG: GNAT family N-acetyltransferase [Actinomycetota bacterium]